MNHPTSNNESRNTYVLIFGFSDVVAGGPIYHLNKIKYLKERGWDTIVISMGIAKNVHLSELKEFEGSGLEFFWLHPGEFCFRQFRRNIELLKSYIPRNHGKIIIETGTSSAAYWGEALAEELRAKHIFIFVDEHFKSVNQTTIDFYKFKFNRRELACIDKDAMYRLFKPFFNIQLDDCIGLDCMCSNVIDDIEHPLNDLKRCDFNIGTIGRLEKGFVQVIINGVLEFAKSNPNKTISFVMFGGAPSQATINNIQFQFAGYRNINLTISGYLYPIPIKALKKCDIFLSGSGSALVSSSLGVTTVRMDHVSFQPMGYVVNAETFKTQKASSGNKVIDYLNQSLIERKSPAMLYVPYNTKKMWETICEAFDKHMQFIEDSSQKIDYFNFSKFKLSGKQQIKKSLRCLLGLKLYGQLRNEKY